MVKNTYKNKMNDKIKRMIEARRKDRVKITLSLDSESVKKMRKISKKIGLTLSDLFDISMDMVIEDPYINSNKEALPL